MFTKYSMRWRMLPLTGLAFVPLLTTLGVSAILGRINSDLLLRYLMVIGGFWLVFIVLLSGGIVWEIRNERAAIEKLMNGEHWVKWAQYENEQAWRAYSQEQLDLVRTEYTFPWRVLILMIFPSLYLGGLIAYASSAMEKETAWQLLKVLIPLSGYFVIFLLVVLLGPWVERGYGEALYRHRMQQPIPVVYMGENGFYHEDAGYTAFKGRDFQLAEVHYISHLHRMNLNISHRTRFNEIIRTTEIYVPSGAEDEARDLEQRLQSEVIRRTP